MIFLWYSWLIQIIVDLICFFFSIFSILLTTQSIDHNLAQSDATEKTIWLFDFESEYEVGKFEQRLFGCWQLLYQVIYSQHWSSFLWFLFRNRNLVEDINGNSSWKDQTSIEIQGEGVYQHWEKRGFSGGKG